MTTELRSRWTIPPAGLRRRVPRSAVSAPPWLVLGTLALLALALRLRPFSASLFSDELSTFYIAGQHDLRQAVHLLYGHSVDLNPPLYFVLAWGSRQILGSSVESLRLVSLLGGVATVPLTYLLVARRSRFAGYTAAVLVALSPLLIEFSSEARPYALLTALMLCVALAIPRALRSDSRWWWAACALLMAACCLTHYTSVFPIAGIWLWAFVSRPAARLRLLGAAAGAAVLFAPWIPAVLADSRSPGTHAIEQWQPFGWHTIVNVLGHWSIGNPYLALSVVPGRLAASAVLAGLSLLLLAGAVGANRRMLGRSAHAVWRARDIAPAVILLVALPAGLAAWSLVAASVWDVRNLVAAWPALAAVLGLLLSLVRYRALRLAAGGLLVAGVAIAALQAQRPSVQRPDYAGAAEFIAAVAPRGAPVVDFPFYTPGPPTETEAALALGPPAARYHPILRAGGLAPLRAVVNAPPYSPLPPAPGIAVARQALRLAHGGEVFVVLAGALPPPGVGGRLTLPPAGSLDPQAYAFLRWMQPRMRIAAQRSFPGLAPVSVYRLSPLLRR